MMCAETVLVRWSLHELSSHNLPLTEARDGTELIQTWNRIDIDTGSASSINYHSPGRCSLSFYSRDDLIKNVRQ